MAEPRLATASSVATMCLPTPPRERRALRPSGRGASSSVGEIRDTECLGKCVAAVAERTRAFSSADASCPGSTTRPAVSAQARSPSIAWLLSGSNQSSPSARISTVPSLHPGQVFCHPGSSRLPCKHFPRGRACWSSAFARRRSLAVVRARALVEAGNDPSFPRQGGHARVTV